MQKDEKKGKIKKSWGECFHVYRSSRKAKAKCAKWKIDYSPANTYDGMRTHKRTPEALKWKVKANAVHIHVLIPTRIIRSSLIPVLCLTAKDSKMYYRKSPLSGWWTEWIMSFDAIRFVSCSVRVINLCLWNIKTFWASWTCLILFRVSAQFYECTYAVASHQHPAPILLSYWNVLDLHPGILRLSWRMNISWGVRRERKFLDEWINGQWSNMTWHEGCSKTFLIYKKWIYRKRLCGAGKEQANEIINHFRLIEQLPFIRDLCGHARDISSQIVWTNRLWRL